MIRPLRRRHFWIITALMLWVATMIVRAVVLR
jgi:hypothetical protein